MCDLDPLRRTCLSTLRTLSTSGIRFNNPLRNSKRGYTSTDPADLFTVSWLTWGHTATLPFDTGYCKRKPTHPFTLSNIVAQLSGNLLSRSTQFWRYVRYVYRADRHGKQAPVPASPKSCGLALPLPPLGVERERERYQPMDGWMDGWMDKMTLLYCNLKVVGSHVLSRLSGISLSEILLSSSCCLCKRYIARTLVSELRKRNMRCW